MFAVPKPSSKFVTHVEAVIGLSVADVAKLWNLVLQFNANFILTLLDSLITSKTRVKLLIKFFSNSGNQGYLRGLAEEFRESTNSVRVELNRLSEAGLLVSEPNGKTKSYRANQHHPLFNEMKSIVAKYLGFDRLVEVVIKNLGNVQKAIVLGDYAKGVDSGTIELLLIGKEINLEYLNFLVEKAEEKIQRKVKVQVFQVEPTDIEGLIVFDVV